MIWQITICLFLFHKSNAMFKNSAKIKNFFPPTRAIPQPVKEKLGTLQNTLPDGSFWGVNACALPPGHPYSQVNVDLFDVELRKFEQKRVQRSPPEPVIKNKSIFGGSKPQSAEGNMSANPSSQVTSASLFNGQHQSNKGKMPAAATQSIGNANMFVNDKFKVEPEKNSTISMFTLPSEANKVPVVQRAVSILGPAACEKKAASTFGQNQQNESKFDRAGPKLKGEEKHRIPGKTMLGAAGQMIESMGTSSKAGGTPPQFVMNKSMFNKMVPMDDRTTYLAIDPNQYYSNNMMPSYGEEPIPMSGTQYFAIPADQNSRKHILTKTLIKWDYWIKPDQTYSIAIFHDRKENTKGLADDKYDMVKFEFVCSFDTNALGQFGVTKLSHFANCLIAKDYYRFIIIVHPTYNKDYRVLNYFEHYWQLKEHQRPYPLNSIDPNEEFIDFNQLPKPMIFYQTKLAPWQQIKRGMKDFLEKWR